MSPPTVETAHGVQFVTRGYHTVDGTKALFAIAASSEAKRIYRTGAEVPFLGNGYVTEPVPPSILPEAPGRRAILVHRGDEMALLLYTHGERRGLLGNGPVAWFWATTDAVLGRGNDYYQLSLLVPLASLEPASARQAADLADFLFPSVAAWYGLP